MGTLSRGLQPGPAGAPTPQPRPQPGAPHGPPHPGRPAALAPPRISRQPAPLGTCETTNRPKCRSRRLQPRLSPFLPSPAAGPPQPPGDAAATTCSGRVRHAHARARSHIHSHMHTHMHTHPRVPATLDHGLGAPQARSVPSHETIAHRHTHIHSRHAPPYVFPASLTFTRTHTASYTPNTPTGSLVGTELTQVPTRFPRLHTHTHTHTPHTLGPTLGHNPPSPHSTGINKHAGFQTHQQQTVLPPREYKKKSQQMQHRIRRNSSQATETQIHNPLGSVDKHEPAHTRCSTQATLTPAHSHPRYTLNLSLHTNYRHSGHRSLEHSDTSDKPSPAPRALAG
jgi:hypothetical protein